VRQPVSAHFSIAGHQTEFLLNACFDADIRLSHLPGADAIVAWKMDQQALHLLDVVAARVPPLADIVGALRVGAAECIVSFPPDRLDWPLTQKQAHTGACDLMVASTGRMNLSSVIYALSPMAEF
jgi:hypothetical protein